MATAFGCRLEQPKITDSSPKVATSSLKACGDPGAIVRRRREQGRAEHRWAATTPAKAPAIWAAT